MLTLTNPATGKPFNQLNVTNFNDLQTNFDKTKHAQKKWQQTPFKERKRIIERFSNILNTHKKDCAITLSQEMGKPVHQAEGEITATLARIKWFLDSTEALLQKKVMFRNDQIQEHLTWDPLGVIAHISAWNFPYFIGTNVIIPGLLTGNGVLYKPSEITPLTGLLIQKFFLNAGLPKDVLQVIIGNGTIAQKLLILPVQGIFFTGSYQTGQKVAKHFTPHFPKMVLELGGKDPAYVCSDSLIEETCSQLIDGAFYNAGQSCCAVERIYVHHECYQSFVDCFIEKAKELPMGDPTSPNTYLGPLARPTQLAYLNQQLNDAKEKKATIALDGRQHACDTGWFFAPSVVLNTNHQMKVMTEESFGPIIGIQKVTTDEEAIDLMNDTPFGLTASVHSTSKERAENILNQLHTGTVYWNTCDRVSPYVPWSGRKHSGIGSSLSEVSIPYFVQPKSWQMQRPK